ncbi:N4-gp56 family major capsid protein [Rhodoferax mekongensis]|uniref:N4-gp56 family major capsid protein n=1 Tax=Rhodoferax mekongensis TaxID=3068341 RepID=A0ABZ0B3V5_9BURK|nr:N4-gp56 family major capsid protein [Rhodoferax sp. TBRC 17307]WNO06046.1 N4-gp56 family major capsid protein [Rhodoferax sp. TBRC 17307]
MQNYSTVPSRNLIMAERQMLKRADPIKVISTFGTQKEVPQNKTDTVVYRRALPIDAAANGAPQVTSTDYLMQEGVTPTARTIQYQDVQATLQQYGVLMKLSAKSELLYEDDIPGDMVDLVGDHMGTIEEMISYGVVRGGTNVVFANGTVRTAVTSTISLNKLRQVARIIEAAHGKKVTQKLQSGVNFGSSAVAAAYLVFIHTDMEADVRNLPGFTPVVEYGQQKPVHEREVGAVEGFRFVTSPYFRPWLQAGGTITAGTFLSNGGTAGTTADVYPVMVVAQDAWGQVALKGMGSIDPIYLPAKQKNHANPMGQFGYVGANFWKNAVRTNENWIVRLECAASGL